MVILTVLLVTCILSCIVSTIQADFIRSRIPNTVDKCSARRDFSNYRTKDKTISKSVYYDYVIVGGGTAGAIVATRLAQDPSNKVLLLEGGGDLQNDAFTSKLTEELFDLPYCDPLKGACPAASLPLHLGNTPLTVPWAFHTDAAQQFMTTTQEYAHNKQLQYSRGGVLGGSSVLNYMIAVRGLPSDFNDLWTNQEGLRSWTYDHVLPYYKKLEHAYDQPSNEYHGTDGPVCLTKPSRFWDSPTWTAIEEIGQRLGYNLTNDFMNPNSNYGIGEQTISVCPNGKRSSSRDYIKLLEAAGQVCYGDFTTCSSPKTNLHIQLFATATKILFDKNYNIPRAYGVQYVNASKTPYMAKTYHPSIPFNGSEAAKFRSDFSVWEEQPAPTGSLNSVEETFQYQNKDKWNIRPESDAFESNLKTVFAKKEVIVAAGVFATPQLLMLSGIGPKAHLEAMDIEVIADLPVGKNLQDHDEYLMTFKANDDSNVYWDVNDLFTHVTNWVIGQKSPMSSNHVPGALDISSDGTIPEVHCNYGEFYYENLDYTFWRDHDPTLAIPKSIGGLFGWKGLHHKVWLVAAAHRCATGSVSLKNSDPLQTPFIDTKLGACKKTIRELIYATKEIRKIMALLPAHLQVTETFPGPSVQSDEDLEHAIRNALLSHQACCTAPMGPCTKPKSVIDDAGRVYFVNNLRVVDISTFPVIPLGNTWITTAMVGEKLADAIKADYA